MHFIDRDLDRGRAFIFNDFVNGIGVFAVFRKGCGEIFGVNVKYADGFLHRVQNYLSPCLRLASRRDFDVVEISRIRSDVDLRGIHGICRFRGNKFRFRTVHFYG